MESTISGLRLLTRVIRSVRFPFDEPGGRTSDAAVILRSGFPHLAMSLLRRTLGFAAPTLPSSRSWLRLLSLANEATTGLGVFAAALTAYALTAPRSIASSDSAELTTAAASLGIPHPPGYPLYVIIGRAFAAIPLGEVGFRLNIMAAVFGALAALLVYATVLELTRHRVSAMVAGLSLAFSYHFWGQSLVAEVYTLDAALVAGVIYTLCLWERTRRPPWLYAAFFLLGLSFAHRTTSALLVPPILTWALMSGSLRYRGAWLRALGCVLPGLALYLLLPIVYLTQPEYMWSAGYDATGRPLYIDLTTLEGLRWYVTAQIFQPLVFAAGPTEIWGEVARYLGWLWSEFAGVGVIVGLIGILRAWARHPAFFQLAAGAFALQAWFFMSYAALDKDQMFLITYLIWALWIGLGTKELLDLVDSGFIRELAAPAARTMALAVPLVLFATNVSPLNFSGEQTMRSEAEALFASAPAATLVVGSWGEIAALQYFQTVEKRRPDLRLVAQWPLTEQHLRRLIRANIKYRPIYVLEDIPALREHFRFVKVGDWFRLEPRTSTGGG